VFSYLRDKWGGKLRLRDVLNPINPINQALESLTASKGLNNDEKKKQANK
jgi:hypothetical protein